MKFVFIAFGFLATIATSECLSHEGHFDVAGEASNSHGDSAGKSDSTDKTGAQTSQVKSVADAFQPFLETVKVRSDGRYLFIESNGLPNHNMMVGIRSWQQQVPLPQPFTAQNAWRIPLNPRLAAHPVSAKTNLFRGAIALAVNGVPVFNALNNRGEDALLAGELDKWGGHCGRGDDYHYHTAPVHLEATVGKGNPIAYALDGFPIFGYTESDGTAIGKLDEFNGQFDEDGNYHYHATKTYPYINGGMRGEVTVREGQIDPQPRDSPARPAGRPLRGATITGFNRNENRFRLDYIVSGREASISYTVKKDGSADFQYQDPSGKTRSESYGRRGGGTYLPLLTGNQTNTSQGDSADPSELLDAVSEKSNESQRLTVSSSAFAASGELPAEFSGDGLGQSPPIAWTKGPPQTASYAVSLWHTPPTGDANSYWLLYDISPDITGLPQNASGIGTAGYNDKGHTDYDPMRSRGPGTKEYHVTVYALSEKPDWASGKITRADLLSTIADITLAEGTLSFQYTRTGSRRWVMVVGSLFAIALVLWLYSKYRRSS